MHFSGDLSKITDISRFMCKLINFGRSPLSCFFKIPLELQKRIKITVVNYLCVSSNIWPLKCCSYWGQLTRKSKRGLKREVHQVRHLLRCHCSVHNIFLRITASGNAEIFCRALSIQVYNLMEMIFNCLLLGEIVKKIKSEDLISWLFLLLQHYWHRRLTALPNMYQ